MTHVDVRKLAAPTLKGVPLRNFISDMDRPPSGKGLHHSRKYTHSSPKWKYFLLTPRFCTLIGVENTHKSVNESKLVVHSY